MFPVSLYPYCKDVRALDVFAAATAAWVFMFRGSCPSMPRPRYYTNMRCGFHRLLKRAGVRARQRSLILDLCRTIEVSGIECGRSWLSEPAFLRFNRRAESKGKECHVILTFDCNVTGTAQASWNQAYESSTNFGIESIKLRTETSRRLRKNIGATKIWRSG